MSTTSRSSRPTSCRTTSSICRRSAGSSTRSSVSTAERSEASGFLSSWVTSAAKASVASIRWRRLWVISCSARASRPISSRRAGSSGTSTSRARPSRTRCAASASRRSGLAMVRARKRDSSIESRSGRAEDQRQREPLRAHHAPHVAGVDGDQQHAGAVADPHRRRDIGRAVGRPAQLGRGRGAGQRRRASGQASSRVLRGRQ